MGRDRPPRHEFDGFTILKGIECDILEKGGMDLPDDVLAEADWVIASVHYGQQRREQITDRIRALENPYVSIVAHPTGRRTAVASLMPLTWSRSSPLLPGMAS